MKRLSDIPKRIGYGNGPSRWELDDIEPMITRWEKTYNLELNPDFQRGHVWTKKQQINFCEFVMTGGQTQPILFNHPEWNHFRDYENSMMVCVDGLQRLTALRKMINNEIKIFGSFLKEYEDAQIMTRKTWISVVVNNLETRNEILQWYVELNSAGTQHTKKELDRVKELIEQ